MSAWHPVTTAPERVAVETRICDERGERNICTLVRVGRMWLFPDMSMYVYYTPTHWRPTA